MKKERVRKKLIDELRKTPIIQVACDRHGVSRQSVYRWMKEDDSFLSEVEEAVFEGSGLVNDAAESNVLNGIKNKDAGYTKFWLKHRHPQFRTPFYIRDESRDVIVQQQAELAKRAEKEIDAWESQWTKDRKEEVKKKAREMLDRWKPYMSKKTSERIEKEIKKTE
jgi:hypothetical protein